MSDPAMQHLMWRPADGGGFDVGYFENAMWQRMQHFDLKSDAVSKVHALYNERAAQKKSDDIFAAEQLRLLTPIHRRCRLSRRGEKQMKEHRPLGTIVGEAQKIDGYRVRWDGLRTITVYAKEFIEEL